MMIMRSFSKISFKKLNLLNQPFLLILYLDDTILLLSIVLQPKIIVLDIAFGNFVEVRISLCAKKQFYYLRQMHSNQFQLQ